MTALKNPILAYCTVFYQSYLIEKDITKILNCVGEDIVWHDAVHHQIMKGKADLTTALHSLRLLPFTFQLIDTTQMLHQLHDHTYLVEADLNCLCANHGKVAPYSVLFHLILRDSEQGLLISHVFFSLSKIVEQKGLDGLTTTMQAIPNVNTTVIDNENMLRALNEDLQMLTNNVPGGIFRCLFDEPLTIVHMSDGFLSLFGYSREEIQQLFHNSFWEMIDARDRQRTMQEVQEQLSSKKTKKIEYRVKHKDGHAIWVLDQGQLIKNDAERYASFYCILIDITQEKRVKEELKMSLERYSIILNQTNDIIFEWDILNDQLTISSNWDKLFDWHIQPDTIIKTTYLDEANPFHPDDRRMVDQLLYQVQCGKPYIEKELRIKNKNKQYIWCRFRITTQFNANHQPSKAIGVIINIDEEKKISQHLLREAQQDALTGIYNKGTVQTLIRNYLRNTAEKQQCALLIVDIDDFKMINDTLGHLFGDAVLSEIAKTIQSVFCDNDVIGRIGGDEFIIFMKDVAEEDAIVYKSKEIIQKIHHLDIHSEQKLHLSCSIGISVYPQHGESFQDLYRKADSALYQAKNEGKDQYALYDEILMSQHPMNLNHVVRSFINEKIDSDTQQNVSKANLSEYVFQVLYKTDNINTAIHAILEIVGIEFDVSRVYIIENDDQEMYACNTFEWCNKGVTPQIDHLQHVSYDDDLGGIYLDNFNEEGIFYCPDIMQLPKEQIAVLEPQGIKALVQCAITNNGIIKGYVGFDECRTTRYWTQEQIDVLAFIAEIMSTFLLKSRAEKALLEEREGLLAVLDNQNSWIYVIEPRTFALLFINKKTKCICPDAILGMHCYEIFMHRTSPCEQCPASAIQGNCKNKTLDIYNPYFNIWTAADASFIKWKGKDAILLSCHDITRYKENNAKSIMK